MLDSSNDLVDLDPVPLTLVPTQTQIEEVQDNRQDINEVDNHV